MKKSCILLAMALCLLLVVPAMAAHSSPSPIMALEAGSQVIYIGEDGYVYAMYDDEPIVAVKTRSLVYADRNHLVVTVEDEANNEDVDQPGMLMSVNLATHGDPKFIANTATDNVYVPATGTIYYVEASNPRMVMGYNMFEGTSAESAKAKHNVTQLRATLEGLVLTTEQEGDLLHDPRTGNNAAAHLPKEGYTINLHDNFETVIDASGVLSMRTANQAGDKLRKIDTQVSAATALDGTIFYIKDLGFVNTLMSYDYAEDRITELGNLPAHMNHTMCAAGENVFMVGTDNVIYWMHVDSHAVDVFSGVPDGVQQPVIVAMEDTLFLYDANSSDGMEDYAMTYSIQQEESTGGMAYRETEDEEQGGMASRETEDEEEGGMAYREVTRMPGDVGGTQNADDDEYYGDDDDSDDSDAEDISDSTMIGDTGLSGTVQEDYRAHGGTLTKGSRGDDVLEVQRLLQSHGYPVGRPDGIYGSGTYDAVRYLQYDMGQVDTGEVTQEFLRSMRQWMPEYERFKEMGRGNEGIRVYDLQVKLRSKGYMSANADGVYGNDTVAAIRLFQTSMGFKSTGHGDVTTLKKLWAKDTLDYPEVQRQQPTTTPKPSSHPKQYKEVSEDDLIGLVRWMNNRFPGGNYDKKSAIYKLQSRLYSFGYLKKSERTKVYDEKTFLAMKEYQMAGDFLPHPSGLPGNSTLQRLFP